MSTRRRHILTVLGLAVLTLACLGKVCNCGFISLDDPAYVVDNPFVQKGLTSATCEEALTTFHAGYWQPLTWLSLQLDSSLIGYEAVARRTEQGEALARRERRPLEQENDPLFAGARGFHVTNLVLHLANVLLTYWVFFRLTGAAARSALAAALFAIHPLHVESVAWVTERKDVLSTLFFLLALLAYAGYVRKPSIARYLLVMLLAFFGMASKPMVVTLPAVLLLLDFWPLGRLDWGQARLPGPPGPAAAISWQRAVLEKVPLLALSLGFSLLTVHAQQKVNAIVPAGRLTLENRLASSVAGYGWYLQKTLVPSGLCVLYLYREQLKFSPPEVLLLIVLLATTYHVVAGARRRPHAAVGWFWFLGMLFPVIGLFQSGPQSYADRFSYVPHLGLFLWLVWSAADLFEKWKMPPWLRPVLASVMLGLLGWTTFEQTDWWQDTPAMMERCWNLDPANHRAAAILAVFYCDRNDYPSAVEWGSRSLAEAPQVPEYYFPLAMAHARLGQLAAAEKLVDQLLRLPERSQTHLQAAMIYDVLGQDKQVVQQLQRHLRIHPDDARAEFFLGKAWERLGQPEKAAPHLKRARAFADAAGGDR